MIFVCRLDTSLGVCPRVLPDSGDPWGCVLDPVPVKELSSCNQPSLYLDAPTACRRRPHHPPPVNVGAPGRHHGSILLPTTHHEDAFAIDGVGDMRKIYIYSQEYVPRRQWFPCCQCSQRGQCSPPHARTPLAGHLDIVTSAMIFLSYLLIAACTALAPAAVQLSNANTGLTLLYQNDLNFTVRLLEYQ